MKKVSILFTEDLLYPVSRVSSGIVCSIDLPGVEGILVEG